MKVFTTHERPGIHSVTVTPGGEFPETAEFMDGKMGAKTIRVQFNFKGFAEVTDALGKYLLDKGYALKRKRVVETD